MPEGSSGSWLYYLCPFPGSCMWGPKWNWNIWITQLGPLYWPSHSHSMLHSYFSYKSFQTTRLTAQCYPISWDTSCYIGAPSVCPSLPFLPLSFLWTITCLFWECIPPSCCLCCFTSLLKHWLRSFRMNVQKRGAKRSGAVGWGWRLIAESLEALNEQEVNATGKLCVALCKTWVFAEKMNIT